MTTDDPTLINPDRKYGEQITLYCVNHPELEWQTKNIAPLGCRQIFFDLFNRATRGECRCPMSDLRPKGIVSDD